ncbi:MAG: SpoIIE family protein phosphatase [Bacteroidales bacterium]|nr:SpoIIE family protein phosphatase [Bacteroidales bacterium]
MVSIHNSKTKKVIRLLQRITFFYAAILISTSTTAQTYYFDNYGVKEGLPQSKVYDVIQDNDGYLWLASESGISKFDGVNFHNYTSEDGLAEGGIKAIIKDPKGNIWMGHKSGKITLYNGKDFQIHPIGEQLTVEITSFLYDTDNILWITTLGDGLIKLENPFELDPNKLIFEQFKGKQLGDRVFSGTIAKNNTVFFITEAGIKKYNKKENSFEGFAPKGLSRYFQITDMHEDKKGDIWFGTFHGGLFRYMKDKDEFKIYDAKRDGLADNWISTIAEDSQGNIWVGTWGGGISKFSESGIKTFNNSNGLADLKIWKIKEDVEGNILIGTNEHGLSVFKGEKFESFSKKDGLIDQNIWSVVQDKGGKYWFGTSKGISIYNPKAGRKGIQFAHYNNATNSIGDDIRYLKNDNNGNIWIGTEDNGVNMYNYKSGRFEFNPIINRYFSRTNSVTALDVDSENQLWVGTLSGIIYYEIDNQKSEFLSQINGLNGSDISAIYADSKDRIWVGINNGKGLNLIIGDSITKIELEGIVTPKCMIEDKEGNIWIGTQTKGVLVYNGNEIIKTITENDGLLSNLINQLNVDDNNNVYVGTSRGLNKIDTKGYVRTYTEKSGFTGIEAKENASYKDKDGNLWFGTVKGVTKYQPAIDICNQPQPLTHIAKLQVNRVDRELIQNQKFSYLENNFTFDYNSICLNNPDAVHYQILLAPADKDWRPITRRTIETYSSLAPGKYIFKVKAKNSAGIWNEEPITYSFSIRPPFYKTWWFILSIIVLILIGIVSYIKVREKNLIKEKKILEDKVEERTAEVVQKSLEIEKKNKDITDSIRYAKRIQTAVLPPEIPFDDTFIFFRPKDIVSGDFYWIETVGNKEMIAAVDCTGHGVPGAFLSILGHSMLTKIVREYGILEPAKILDQLDLEIINALHQKNVRGERVVNDGMDLALMCYNKDTQILEYSGGYNPLIKIRDGELEEIKADRFPIGMTTVHKDKKFTNHEIKVQKGDSFFIFSDGYADQFGGPNGRKFQKKNMKNLLLSIQNMPMKEQGVELEKIILDWMKSHEQIDDIVFIGRRF